MITIDKEVVLKVRSEPTMLKKDIIWRIDQTEYVVRNVPYVKLDADGEEFLDMDVSVTMTALRDLMVENEIPHDVDYEDFAHIEF
ncbi:hypothetical protein CVD25_17205 [Bacillus canaveralius]|uniref:Uncharacterized protein n=1 Tax=Bacillus canaveralius TaxID=1403243 RepID=A0A2N5GSV4_9BACI|nr:MULTISPECIES: hypothetical protein [Bacillus]PLR83591.1 hypothetical protein CVD23_13925 [Bacillus sp. V33-4]PLR86849.1 hypothetical protein CU635_00745 [Bacillus canaveralius]PLR93337.1 hypothetical protein CVD25_17205 [Bacillus canaveralius]RSK56451.1 hypothetical protein EJA13_02135 [Bacillus canaveralius]